MIKRITTIRSTQTCRTCGMELLKGSNVFVTTYVKGRTMKRFYECLNQ